MMIGDANRLRQIIVNLVGNAIKFTDQGEVLVDVECESRTQDEAVLHFSVADTGIGIPKDKQEAVFVAFVQGDTAMSRRLGGTGLGLAISSRLVQLTGGRIWVDSEVGRGSIFHFTTRVGLPRPETAEAPAPPPSGILGLRVLVVDDNATNRDVVGQVLRNWEMQPTLADSAAEALQRLREAQQAGTPCQLLLADAAMPQTDGFTLLRQVREQIDPAPATIMMLASGDRAGDISRCEQLGVSAYVLKPIKQSDLFDAILVAMGFGILVEQGSEPSAAARARPLRRLRVLLVEDSLMNQKLVEALLERQGHQVIVANDGQEGVAAARTQPLDLILMDIQMPHMDGLEATVAIRQAEKQKGTHVPIIAMTAHAMQGDRERCLEAGMDEYLAKPIRSQRLFDTIAAVMEWNAESGKRKAESGEGGADVGLETPLSVSGPHPEGIRPGSETRPPPPAESIGAGVVDWPTALRSVEGDLALLKSIVAVFLDESPRLIGEISRAISEAGDGGPSAAGQLVRPAHTLKGSLSYLGAQRAYDIALRLETMGREGHCEQAEDVFAALQSEMERVTAALRDYLL
jgi:CheY-like chemotaxis protein